MLFYRYQIGTQGASEMDYDNGTECQNCGYETCNGLDCADVDEPDIDPEDEMAAAAERLDGPAFLEAAMRLPSLR